MYKNSMTSLVYREVNQIYDVTGICCYVTITKQPQLFNDTHIYCLYHLKCGEMLCQTLTFFENQNNENFV